MKAILLTRESRFQIYCANKLLKQDLICNVIVEDGTSIPDANQSKLKFVQLKKYFKNKQNRYSTLLLRSIRRPNIIFYHIKNRINNKRYNGNRDYHALKVLGKDIHQFIMPDYIKRVRSINSNECMKILIEKKPDIILVFGTRLISNKVFANPELPNTAWINLHWGISPYYRGEGIISALAKGGISDVGVTVHYLNIKADAGDIIKQGSPALERELDNFYSIGLKLTKIGTNIFEEILTKYYTSGRLPQGKPQDLETGFMYSSSFMRENPKLQTKAWENLKKVK